jgi:hypothetical protein
MTTERSSRGRSILVAVLGILACIAITISATTLWVHQIALNTDRYVSVVSGVASDPAVIEEVSTTLAERVTDRIVDRVELPPVVVPLLENWLREQIASFMASEAFADGWTAANRAAHTALVRILRSEAVLPEEPVTISVSELLVIGIQRLQQAGVIPDDVQLPDPSDREAVQAIRQILAERLDIEVPPDFGQITLARSERLETARQVVRIFDIVTVVSVLVALALVVLTIWLARNRLRAVLLLGIGTALALLVAVAGTSAFSGVVADAVAESGARNTIGAFVNALLGDLATALVLVLAVGALAILGIVVVSREPEPAEAMAIASPYPAPFAPLPTDLEPVAPPPAVSSEVSSPPAAETVARSPAPKRATKAAPKAAAKPAAKPPTKATAKPAVRKPRTPKGPPAST